MEKPRVYIHPSVTEHVKQIDGNGESESFSKRALQAGAAGVIATTVGTMNIAPVSATENTTHHEEQTDADNHVLRNRVEIVFDTANIQPQDYLNDSDGKPLIGGIGDIVRPGHIVEPSVALLGSHEPSVLEAEDRPLVVNVSIAESSHSEIVTIAEQQETLEETKIPIIGGLIDQPLVVVENIEEAQVSGTIPEETDPTGESSVIMLNGALADIDISQTRIEIDAVINMAKIMDGQLRENDEKRPNDLPEGVIKLYLHHEADGLGVPLTVAERTAEIERFGTEKMVGTIYAMAEVYQQLVESEFPQYEGSMLRVRDLFSPYHATHNADDVDISSSMGPTVDWYSDGPAMDKYNDNYDADFTRRFLELISRLHIDDERAVHTAIFEDRAITNYLDDSVDPSFGGFAQWHKDHTHIEGQNSGVNYDVDPSLIPWTHDQDLRIRSEGVEISEAQMLQEHGEFLEMVENDEFPIGSLRGRSDQQNAIPETVIAEPATEEAPVYGPQELPKNQSNRDGGYSPNIYYDVAPDISDISVPELAGYTELVAQGELPDPYEYQFFENGDPVNLLQAMEISQEIQDRGWDYEWGETQLVRLTPEEYIDLYRLAGIPEYDLANMVGMTRGESTYFVQRVGDRGIGGAVGAGQHLEKYLTDPEERSFLGMFDAWQNVLETRAKYIDNWRRLGFENRFITWNAVNDNTSEFQAGVVDGTEALQRQ